MGNRPPLDQSLKAAYICTHIGCNVKVGVNAIARLSAITNDHDSISIQVMLSNPSYVLLLRSIESLTDSEAIEVAKIAYPVAKDLHDPEDGRSYLDWPDETYSRPIVDFLRSVGIALGFMGYSEEELIAAGWVRIQGKEGGAEG